MTRRPQPEQPPCRAVSWVRLTPVVIALHRGPELAEQAVWVEVLAAQLGVELPQIGRVQR